MAESTGQFDKTRRRSCCIERMNDSPRLTGWIKPVSIKADQAETRFRPFKRMSQSAAMGLSKIKIIHRPGYVEIAVGIKTVDKADPLMPQIAFDLEVGVKTKCLAVASCRRRPNFSVRPASDK